MASTRKEDVLIVLRPQVTAPCKEKEDECKQYDLKAVTHQIYFFVFIIFPNFGARLALSQIKPTYKYTKLSGA